MKRHSTDELIEIVGAKRHEHPADEVAAAEAELRMRTALEVNIQVQKLRRAGAVCAFIGGLLFCWGTVGITLFAAFVPKDSGPSAAQSTGFMFRHFDLLFTGTAILESVLGLALFFGGIAVRRFHRWGVRSILLALWGFMAFTVGSTALWIVSLFSDFGEFGVVGVVTALFAVAMAAFWVFILYLPMRYFRSAQVETAFTTGTAA